MPTRIDARFKDLRARNRAALITFVMAGDPDLATSLEILKALPGAGADVIEVGMPFTDPMADGPAIQAAGLRALRAGTTLKKTLKLVADFRASDQTTPIVLMGYYNPIYVFGVEPFLAAAVAAGVDGLIVVDLPPEEDAELCLPARAAGLNFIRLATPTTDDKRLPKVLENTSGFVYYVSLTGITGAALADYSGVAEAVARIKRHTNLPIAVGFGVKSADNAEALAKTADGVVVGTALVGALKDSLDAGDRAGRGRFRPSPRSSPTSREASPEPAGRPGPGRRWAGFSGRSRRCGHELVFQRRPAENQSHPEARGSRKPLGQMPRERPTRVPQGYRS